MPCDTTGIACKSATPTLKNWFNAADLTLVKHPPHWFDDISHPQIPAGLFDNLYCGALPVFITGPLQVCRGLRGDGSTAAWMQAFV